MQESDRKKIQNNFSSLVEQTDIDLILPALYEKGVFSDAMIEPYKDTSQPAKKRKRELFRHIERRGPHAFQNLIDTLMENGYYDLVRSLDPENSMARHYRNQSAVYKSEEAAFISLRGKTINENKHQPVTVIKPENNNPSTSAAPPAPITVMKSTKFVEHTDNDIECYVTRKKKRGICLIITNIQFENNHEEYRYGADKDQENLRNLFFNIGFSQKSPCYKNLKYDEMRETITNFAKLEELREAECMFLVIASHGYERNNDVDIACSDGGLIQRNFIISQFDERNCPGMRGKPKVFIFQSCRGESYNEYKPANSVNEMSSLQVAIDGVPIASSKRVVSDILIAHSTVPGYVAHRDISTGSWYIQTLCRVFAARAHDTHVEKLFKLVDIELNNKYQHQTSAVENWGFNKLLYLHPGLFED